MPTRPIQTSTRPPRGVNFTAFETRFHTTCCSRSGSPSTIAVGDSLTSWSRISLASAAERAASTAASATGSRSVSRGARRSLPVTIRE